MLAGQVGIVTKNPGWYGRAIQFFTASTAFHTVTAISETECVSAETPKVRIRQIDFFDGIIWTDEPMTDEQRTHAVHYIGNQVGKPYAYIDIFFLLVARITKRRTPTRIINRLESRTQWFCSELADAGMVAAGIHLFPDRPACTVTPADFLNVVKSRANETVG